MESARLRDAHGRTASARTDHRPGRIAVPAIPAVESIGTSGVAGRPDEATGTTAPAPLIVGIGGTTRANSSSEKALRAALRAAESAGARTQLIAGAALDLPAYDPAVPERSAAAAALVRTLREADGVLIASPSYHGSLSGMLKNALDYTEDMRRDARPYLDGRAVGCIVCAEGPQAMGATLAAMRAVVHALRGWPTPFAATIDSGARPFDADGTPQDPAVARSLELVAAQVMEFVSMRRALLAGRVPTPALA